MARRQRPGTRAKDSDRADICQILDTALAEGQLSMEEHRQRVAAATNAPTLAELHGLLTDLQVENAPVKPPRRISAPGWVIASAVGAAVVLVLGFVIWGVFDRDPPDQDGQAPAAAPANTGADPGARGLRDRTARQRHRVDLASFTPSAGSPVSSSRCAEGSATPRATNCRCTPTTRN